MFHSTKNNLSRSMTKINKCQRCGATSYKPVIKRDESGTMMPSGEHQCVGCKMVFTDIDAWRTATAEKQEVQTEGQDRQ
jgi:ribosomal protein L37AE/L43A